MPEHLSFAPFGGPLIDDGRASFDSTDVRPKTATAGPSSEVVDYPEFVRGAVERHGPEPGTGPVHRPVTEFTVTVPAEDEPPALSTTLDGAPAPTCRRRVLVVEDNRDSAMSLSVLLELMGHEVRVAYTGPEAVAMAAEWPPEVAISDIGLPGFDGFEVARRLRGQLGNGPLLVALTGYGRDEDRRLSREAGFDHHLVKPADPAELQRMLVRKR
jgi:CheY-like chemotaxis protein